MALRAPFLLSSQSITVGAVLPKKARRLLSASVEQRNEVESIPFFVRRSSLIGSAIYYYSSLTTSVRPLIAA